MISIHTHLRLAAVPPAKLDAASLQRDGRIGYAIFIENTSAVPAQLPFFCVMDLGLNLEAQRDWQLEKIVSEGRKLVRCSFRGITPLITAQPTLACTLFLHVSKANGGRVSFGAGAAVPPENFKDLKLFTISGAANFPAQRSQLLIQTDSVREDLAHLLSTGTAMSAKLAS